MDFSCCDHRTIGIAVSTILHCFVADEEMYGDEGSLYVPDELDEFLNKLNEGLGMDIINISNKYEQRRLIWRNVPPLQEMNLS